MPQARFNGSSTADTLTSGSTREIHLHESTPNHPIGHCRLAMVLASILQRDPTTQDPGLPAGQMQFTLDWEICRSHCPLWYHCITTRQGPWRWKVWSGSKTTSDCIRVAFLLSKKPVNPDMKQCGIVNLTYFKATEQILALHVLLLLDCSILSSTQDLDS